MTDKDAKRRYIGRVEIFAAKSEIEQLIGQGYPYAWIFEKLQKEGKLSISYRQFCRCLKQYCCGDDTQKTLCLKKSTQESTQKQPKIIRDNPPVFRWEAS